MMENRQRDRAKLTKRGEIEKTIYVYIHKPFFIETHNDRNTPPTLVPSPLILLPNMRG